MEGVRIVRRNFTGLEAQFNPPGQRNFLVLLPDNVAADMEADGWNVKYLQPKEDEVDGKPQPFLKVKVNFEVDNPPQLVLVTERGKTKLTKDEMLLLDFAEIINVDLIVSPYNWDVSGKTGVTAYLKKGYFTIQEDALDVKYADVADTAAGTAASAHEAMARREVQFEDLGD
jgi:hypothetical protein